MKASVLITRLSVVCLLCFLTACVAQFEPVELTEIPVRVSQPGTQDVNVGVVLASAERQVQQLMPGAHLTFFRFSGDCRALPQLHGTIILRFVEVRGIARSQVLSAYAFVNTVERTMDLSFEDHSDYYVSTVPLSLQGNLPVSDIAMIAYENIVELDAAPCDVSLIRADIQGTWLVVCTESGSGSLGSRQCEFEIDPTTGQILVSQQ